MQPNQKGHTYPLQVLLVTIAALLIASAPMSAPAVAEWGHSTLVESTPYKKTHGHWDIVNLPQEFRLNTIHAALLPTGKVLLVAGSGNDPNNFNQYYDDGVMSVLKTVVYDPETNQVKTVPTPRDLFCSGHAMLQSGNLLVAGGTTGYEKLAGTVTKPAGTMLIHDENPNDVPRTFKKGTKFISRATGKVYVSTSDVTTTPASLMDDGQGGTMVMHSTTPVFVEAVAADKSYETSTTEQYDIEGLTGNDAKAVYGEGQAMTLNKQDYRGDNQSYEFNPYTEQYEQVGNLNVSRWYPSLPVMTDGDVLAVSGLDNTGTITKTYEEYSPTTKQWTLEGERPFPTYPALFRTTDPNVLFFSGSNAGYGPNDIGRQPGYWNVKTNDFTPVTGLRQPNLLETSGSVSLPPTKGSNDGSQSWRVMVAGGGGIGESPYSTARTDIIDTSASKPAFTPGPDLPGALRYPNLVVTPWDEVIVSGGSPNYRAEDGKYNYKTVSINPTTNTVTSLADELVGRSYHSGALLLPDGRILVFGNNPLYKANNSNTDYFEQRLEIFTPPELYDSPRPNLQGSDVQEVQRGQELTFTSSSADTIKTARLIPPSTTTHVTNVEQRSVGAIVKSDGQKVTISLPSDENVLPNGWYMLFVTNASGTPSQAKWVHVNSAQ